MTKKCVVEGCGKPSGVRGTARGLCSMHYSRHLRNGDPSIRSQHVYLTHQTCSVKDCDRLVVGRGLCSMHWARRKRHGDVATAPYRNYWSDRDVKRLEMILDRSPDGLGWALPGELIHAALVMERTRVAVCSKLVELRKARRSAQNAAIMNASARG